MSVISIRTRPRRAAQRRLFVAAETATETNLAIAAAFSRLGFRAAVASPRLLADRIRHDDVVVGRIDVVATLDGVEPAIWALARVCRDGVVVLNAPPALLAAHDKLATALHLARAGVAHPRTSAIDRDSPVPEVETAVVVKPRFGSWGRDVFLCESRAELARRLSELSRTRWFARHGALVQEYVPHPQVDLRLVVAGGRVVGAVQRIAAAGEWRTNVALGARRRRVSAVPAQAAGLALRAAAAVGCDLVGVDLLPTDSGGWIVLELNGAVDFCDDYALPGRDVFDDAAAAVLGEPLSEPIAAASSPLHVVTSAELPDPAVSARARVYPPR